MKTTEIRRRLIEINCDTYDCCSSRKKNGCFNRKIVCLVAQRADGEANLLNKIIK